MSLEKTYELASSWTKKGFQVNTHAIGDAANRLVVDVYERLLQERGEADNKQLRYRIEHAQILVRPLPRVESLADADGRLQHSRKSISSALGSSV